MYERDSESLKSNKTILFPIRGPNQEWIEKQKRRYENVKFLE